MPEVRRSIDSDALVARWHKRRRDILKTLPPDLLAEYRRLGIAIKQVRVEEAKAREQASRVSMSIQKNKVVALLTKHGPATRGQIIDKANVPPGSLSQLLSKESEFEQLERGLWGLRGQGKKPGTSAPPAK